MLGDSSFPLCATAWADEGVPCLPPSLSSGVCLGMAQRCTSSVNPATGEKIAEYPYLTDADAAALVDRAAAAFGPWRRTPYAERGARLHSAAAVLRRRRDTLAELIAREMGKPIREGRAEVEKCAWVCEYYAENIEAFMKDEAVDTGNQKSFVTLQPLGVILIVMPWNFPLWQVRRCRWARLRRSRALAAIARGCDVSFVVCAGASTTTSEPTGVDDGDGSHRHVPCWPGSGGHPQPLGGGGVTCRAGPAHTNTSPN